MVSVVQTQVTGGCWIVDMILFFDKILLAFVSSDG